MVYENALVRAEFGKDGSRSFYTITQLGCWHESIVQQKSTSSYVVANG